MSRKVLSWLLVILWMSLIFFQSHKPAAESNSLSKGVTQVIVETVEKIDPDIDINVSSFNHILRKNAHFFSYLVLAVLVANALKSSGINGSRLILLAFLICVLYAMSDEFHQLFVPGRGGQIKDVLIDSGGALIGILVFRLKLIFKKDLNYDALS